MPIQYEVEAPDRVVVVTLIGALAVSDYAASAREILSDVRVQSGFGLLVDGRQLHPLPGLEELRELVHVARELCARGIEPFALVAANDAQFVVGRLFASLAGATINLDVRVFRSLEVGQDWLSVAAANKERERSERSGGAGSPSASS